ncbi:MAG: hypothetical protein PVF58_19550, partial [Candidatus Methanofastidiosia archaeon]
MKLNIFKWRPIACFFVILILSINLSGNSEIFAETRPSLKLHTPEIDGLTVTINGVTLPGTEGEHITKIYWEWGD